jgi:hypothetical protein
MLPKRLGVCDRGCCVWGPLPLLPAVLPALLTSPRMIFACGRTPNLVAALRHNHESGAIERSDVLLYCSRSGTHGLGKFVHVCFSGLLHSKEDILGGVGQPKFRHGVRRNVRENTGANAKTPPRRMRSGARGANDRTRTGDLSLTRGLLYQLSYVGVRSTNSKTHVPFLADRCRT